MAEKKLEPSKTVDLSAGGAVKKYGQPGAGWGCVLRYKNTFKRFSGSAKSKSEFRMELLGIVNGLKKLDRPCFVQLHIATEYLIHCADQLLGPRRSYPFVADVHHGMAKNADLWKEFQELSKTHSITTRWVPFRSHHEDICRARNAAWMAASHPAASANAYERPAICQ